MRAADREREGEGEEVVGMVKKVFGKRKDWR